MDLAVSVLVPIASLFGLWVIYRGIICHKQDCRKIHHKAKILHFTLKTGRSKMA